MITIECADCGLTTPRRGPRQLYCPWCARKRYAAQRKDYYKRNRGELLEYQQDYYKLNSALILDKLRKRYAKRKRANKGGGGVQV